MPLIVGTTIIRDPDPLLNGFLVDRGRRGTVLALYGDVPASVRAQSLAAQDIWISDFLTTQLNTGFAAVHIFSLGPPMDWVCLLSDVPPPANWWQRWTAPPA